MLYLLQKQPPWKMPLEVLDVQERVDTLLLKTLSEKRLAYTHILFVTYIFQSRWTDDLAQVYDQLCCHVFLRPTLMDPAVHLLPLGIETSTTYQSSSHRVFYSSYTIMDWILHFCDAAAFSFFVSRGAPLEKFFFAALGSPNYDISIRAARQYALPAKIRLPASLFLSVDVIRVLVHRGMDPAHCNLHLHCADQQVFAWCERNFPLLFGSFSEDQVQQMLAVYIAHDIYDIPRKMLTSATFQALFPVNRTLRILLNKTSPEAVFLLKTLYSRRASPITFDNGMTALQYSAQVGNRAMVTALLESGDHAFRAYTNAFPGLTTIKWFGLKTASTYAAEAHHESLAKFIEEWTYPEIATLDHPEKTEKEIEKE